MPPTEDKFAQQLQNLIKKFDADKEHYLSKAYSEAQARIDFITPFFKALGWDVENEAGLPHHEREVIVERGETEGRPDYNFRLGGQTKFFVEAKAPSEPLDTARHILQAKGYAWNTRQVFFVVLTDFVELRFYDASIKPDERKPDEGLLLKLASADYPKNTEKLWKFSRERVAAGSLDAMLPRDRRTQRLRIAVDEAFLDEMTGWREDLARNIFKNNPELTAKQLNEVVQRLLDRIVFVRIAEDRQIIEKRQLADAVDEWKARGDKIHIYTWLNDLFHKINEDFNGEIFKPHLSETIKIDSEVLARIIEGFYPPKSPYRFDLIGVELLGSIYERYLGKTIRPTAKTVRVEEKPEVRKAGGVYYTPKYIVDYIVKNTVGKVIEGKIPKQIEKIRILDPACGSGSFLIGAFQYLIDYHVRYLAAHPKEAHIHPLFPDLVRDGNGGLRLSVRLKAKILKNNLFGVDIDPQAVEITMMSLYLKALEGEKSLLPAKHSLLPELKYNIICGNSLIGPDIYKDVQLGFFGDEEKDRINAFDWTSQQAGFGQIMKGGGFDCAIGNPPWGYDFSEEELVYLRHTFSKTIVRMIDSFMFFVTRAFGLVRPGGRVGMIVPDVLLYQVDNLRLRELILNNSRLIGVANLGDRVFSRVTRPCCIFVAESGAPGRNVISVSNLAPFETEIKEELLADASVRHACGISQREVSRLPGKLIPFDGIDRYRLWFKLKKSKSCVDLSQLVDRDGIQRGVSPDLKEAFIVTRAVARRWRMEKTYLRKVLLGGDIKRFSIQYADRVLLYMTGADEAKAFPRIREYITSFKKEITCAEVRDGKHSIFRLHRPRDEHIFLKVPKLVGVITEDEPVIARDNDQLFATDGVYLFASRPAVSSDYLLGILNSELIRFLYRLAATETNRVLAQVKPAVLETLPVRVIDAGNIRDKARHDKLVTLVERMLELNKRKHSGKLAPSELDRVDREIAATDAEIDELVYELYGISDEERRVIEGE